jgi:hypothetical protein
MYKRSKFSKKEKEKNRKTKTQRKPAEPLPCNRKLEKT